jgi:Fe-S-cluster containining protein
MSSSPENESPLGLAEEVNQLMKMPQHLCHQRGNCCKVATFKGSLSHDEIKALSVTDSDDAEHARDFSSVFVPYENQQAARDVADIFVERVRRSAEEKGSNPDEVTFFKCKFVLEDGRCGVHEDRPQGCRAYPFPHVRTIYHPGCGFEKQSRINWDRISEILTGLGMDPNTMGQTE